MKEHENGELTRLYRERIREEVGRPGVQEEKRAFVNGHFSPAPVFFFRPGFLVPAAMMAAVFLVFLRFQPMQSPERPEGVRKENRVLSPAAKKQTRSVEVRRLSSTVGPTMVYQKSNQESSVTVVWVFKPGLR